MEWPNEHNATEESSTPNLVETPSRSKHHYPFSGLVSKLFDERISLRKKRKWMNKMATVKKDGTVELELPEDLRDPSLHLGSGAGSGSITELEQQDPSEFQDLPPMQIVMLIVGTRGDVQPFIAIGKRLQEYGHRVRLASHQNFKDFVLSSGLEFFPWGGDPKILIGYMVKNKGFLPSEPSELLHLALATPILFDFYNYDADRKELAQLFVKFTQKSSALFGALLFFIGMTNSMPRRQAKKKARKSKTN